MEFQESGFPDVTDRNPVEPYPSECTSHTPLTAWMFYMQPGCCA